MALPNEKLFLDRFVLYNNERYKDEPRIVNALNALSVGNVLFSNYRKVPLEGSSEMTHLVDLDQPGILIAHDQQYIPADYVENGASQVAEADPLPLEELQTRKFDGIYRLQESVEPPTHIGAVLVLKGEKTAENIRLVVKENCFFMLDDEEIVIDDELTLVTIDSHTVVGVLQIVEGIYARGEPIYDGTYNYDGTITY